MTISKASVRQSTMTYTVTMQCLQTLSVCLYQMRVTLVWCTPAACEAESWSAFTATLTGNKRHQG